MIEKKLVVGRLLDLSVIPVSPPLVALGGFQTQAPVILNISESAHSSDKLRNVALGAHATKTRRTFQWLSWVPGATNQMLLGGVDLITGPMTGCWVNLYKIGGVPYVGHVGTENLATSTNSIEAKRGWDTWAGANAGDLIGGFNPMRHWKGPYPAAIFPPKGTDGAFKMFGVVTALQKFYSLFTYEDRNIHGQIRIAGLQKIDPTPPAGLVPLP
jgi:hypothetical protein